MAAAGLGREEDDHGEGETNKEGIATGSKNGEDEEESSQKLCDKIIVVVHSNYRE